MQFSKSNKLANVCYDIRGPVLKHAKRLEEEGHRILKLNIGNPAPFGFEAPDEILQDVIRNLPTAQGYSDSKGLFSARKAVMQYYQQKQVEGVGIEDIYLGNGVSELIVMALQALLNNMMKTLDYIANNPSAGLSLQQYRNQMPSESVRMAIAIVIVIPIACAYPFFQKYFISGLTIGAVKG